jgi:L-alanine-DL-glutamate epimerase-like enolase superfamily enzyme
MTKVKSVETFSTENIAVVRIKSDDGLEGYGQVAPYNADITAAILHRQMARHVLGADPSDVDALVEKCVTAEHKFPGSYTCRAISGIDTALWDLKGKREGKSVSALLGGTRSRIPVYGSSMRRDITPEDEAKRLARLKGEKGFQAFKIRVGNKFGNNVDAWPGRTEAVVPAVRRAVGDDTEVLCDANSGFTVERAIEVGRMLEDNNVGHFEEPVPYPELEWAAEVAAALTIPVSQGEQEVDLAQFRRMIRMGAADIVQPDICYIGGISRARAVAKMAQEAGLPCTPHAANRSMVTLFTMHLQAALPNAGHFMEFSIEETPWLDDLFVSNPFKVTDGQVNIPAGPGWGVDINKDWLAKAEYRITTK